MLFELLGILIVDTPTIQTYQKKWASEHAAIVYEIKTKAKEYNIDPDLAIRIAKCESEFNPNAENPNSSAVGVYQFLSGTADYIGLKDRYDYKQNIQAFMQWYPKHPEWWECR